MLKHETDERQSLWFQRQAWRRSPRNRCSKRGLPRVSACAQCHADIVLSRFDNALVAAHLLGCGVAGRFAVGLHGAALGLSSALRYAAIV